MTSAERQRLGAWWLARAKAELEASAHFSLMARRLAERGSPPEIVDVAERAVSDEVRHAELCLTLAASHLGDGVSSLAASVVDEPKFGVANRELTTTLHVVSSSCFSETIACGFLRECLRQAAPGDVRSVLREILADEIGHARLGWAYVVTLPAAEKREIARAVPALLRTVREAWLADGTAPELPRGHGSLSRVDLERVVEEAIDTLIAPGLSHVGVR